MNSVEIVALSQWKTSPLIRKIVYLKLFLISFFSFYFFQESEIVEVLWKQDVDLGYTLAPAKAASSKDATVNSSGTVLNTDDKEKLKALQDLKNDKVCEGFVI